jgi:O-antigen/teichoic acid export membrane protein
MNLRKTAISGVKWTTVGTIGRSLFQLLQISILTRFLPKEAFGLVAMALFVVQFSNIFVDMGMASAILHRQNATKNEYSSIYWLNIFISLFLYGILFISTPFVSRFYNEPELLTLIPILATNLLLMASGRQHRTIMQKQFQFKAIALTELISFLIGLIAAILLAINDFGVYSLVYSTLLSSFISNSLFLVQNLRLNPIRFHFRISETKPFLKIGGFTMGSTLIDFFSNEIDVLIIGKMLGAESLGVYSLAKQIVRKLFSIINPIVINVLSPLLSSIQKEKQRLKVTYLKVVNYLAYINFPIYVLVIVASKEILHIVYGAAYAESYVILSFLAFSYCLTALSNPVGSLQIATGRTDIGFKWTIFRVITTTPVIFAGALISIEAVAAFYAILSLIYILPLWLIQLKPMANIKLKEYVKQFDKPFLFFLGATLIIYLLGDKTEITNNIITNVIIKVSVTVVAFALFVISFDKKSVSEIYKLFTSTIKRNK